ncbi:MAG: pirin family protein [Actinomycetota bacterium]
MSNLEQTPMITASEECEEVEARPVHELLEAREVDLGEGTPVRRLLPTRRRATIGAWCFVDHFGPLDIGGRRGMWVPPHPHTGLQTVTWLVDGEILHRDSLGNRQPIRPGRLNLMTAGRGIAHSEESPPDHQAVLHGVQLWVALPSGSRAVVPAFEHLEGLPTLESDTMLVTVLVGDGAAGRSEARTYSDLVALELDVSGPTDEDLPVRPDFEHGAIVLDGEATVDGVPVRPGALLYLGTGRSSLAVRTAAPARIILLGGTPFGEPLFMWWNFVGHSVEEIVEAREDWVARRRFGEVLGFDGPRLEAPSMIPGRLKPRG